MTTLMEPNRTEPARTKPARTEPAPPATGAPVAIGGSPPSTTAERENIVFTRTAIDLDRPAARTAGAALQTPGLPLVAAGPLAQTLPCRRRDADLWFAEAPAELDQAKQLCSTCRVRLACLAGAISRQEPWGVWGGEIFEHGAIIARKRPRGRPRKDREAAA